MNDQLIELFTRENVYVYIIFGLKFRFYLKIGVFLAKEILYKYFSKEITYFSEIEIHPNELHQIFQICS